MSHHQDCYVAGKSDILKLSYQIMYVMLCMFAIMTLSYSYHKPWEQVLRKPFMLISRQFYFLTVAQKVIRDCTLAIRRIPNLLGDIMLRDCTLAIRTPNLLGGSVLRDCTLAIRTPNLLGDIVLRDCTLAIQISNPQSLRR